MPSFITRIKTTLLIPLLLVIFIFGVGIPFSQAQLKEPEVIDEANPLTPYGQGLNNRWGVNLLINNFGFGLTANYARVVSPFTEITVKTGITGLRDVTEQNFQDFFTGRQIIPNKFNRALAFPLLVGVKQRLFANKVADNFRFFFSASAGPAVAFVYPYLNDTFREDGFRTFGINNVGQLQPVETINDFFSRWGDGSTEWGGAGEIKLGVDLGSNFKKQTTVEIGYYFYYFNQGIQILEPGAPQTDANGRPLIDPNTGLTIPSTDPDAGFDDQKYFGTPQISIIFGGFW